MKVMTRKTRPTKLLSLVLASLFAASANMTPWLSFAADRSAPPFVTRGLPGPGHDALKPLAGDWTVTMELYVALGSAERPFKTTLTAHREWVADGRYLEETVKGDLPNGERYWRRGTLGYSTMDKRYEWVTHDALNTGMMIYLGEPDTGPGLPINMTGAFTDQGILGESYAGRSIGQRTVIEVQDEDHHTIDIYFTPPGERERLIDRKFYARVKKLKP
jgi:hypothetical protein